MVVLTTQAAGKMVPITARAYPRLVLVKPQVKGSTLILDAPDMTALTVPIDDTAPEPRNICTVKVDGERVEGVDCGDEAAEWLTKYLGKPRLRLVYHTPTSAKRQLHMRNVEGLRHEGVTAEDTVVFPDLCPFLVLSQASVDELNKKLTTPVTMKRFRPNILATECGPHAEDTWAALQAGDSKLQGTWQCPRCIFTTIDPETGVKNPDKQPLETLKTYRMKEDDDVFVAPMFGRYFFTQQQGVISVGDHIKGSQASL